MSATCSVFLPFRASEHYPLQNRPVRVVGILAYPSRPPATTHTCPGLPKTFTQQTPTPSPLIAKLLLEPFPGLPIGRKRAFPSPTLSDPNRPWRDILLQNRRDRGDIADHVFHDLFDVIDGLTCQRSHCRRLSGHRHRSLRCGWNVASQLDSADLYFLNFRPKRVNRP